MIRRLCAYLATVVAAVLLAACSSSGAPSTRTGATGSQLNDNPGTATLQGAGLDPAQPRPQFTLTSMTGQQFAFGTVTAKHPTLLYFGYTHCPDVCPETMADVMLALKGVPTSVAKKTYVVFVTTDVKRDTGAVLSQWLGNFSKNNAAHWVGLTGTQSQVDAAQAAAHVTLAEDDGQTHSASVLLYGPDDYAHVIYLQSTNEQQQIQHDLPKVAAGKT